MRRLATATLAGLTVFGLVSGLAASMEVSGGATLGSGNVVTAACDDAITMAYGLSTGTSAGHHVTEVTSSGVAAVCDGLDYHLDVLGGTSGVLATHTGTVSLSGDVFSVDIDDQAAADVAGVNITITG